MIIIVMEKAQSLPPKVEKEEKAPSLLSRALGVAAAPVSLAVGLFFGHSRTRIDSYNNFKKRGMFDDLKLERDAKVKEVFTTLSSTEDVTKELQAIDSAYSLKVDERMPAKGYTNILKRFNSLHYNQKLETVLTAFTAAGISLGVILTIADHKLLRDGLSQKTDGKDTAK